MREKSARERLLPVEISRLKELLWQGGASQAQIAELASQEFNRPIAQYTVSRVKQGQLGATVPWPNGSVGRIPRGRIRVDQGIEWSFDANRFMSWPDSIKDHILSAVNEERERVGRPEIPPISPEYAEYISVEMQEEGVERTMAMIAEEAEDMRRATVMQEFDALAQRTQEEMSDESLSQLLTITAEERAPHESITRHTLTYNKLPWDRVLKIAHRHEIVLETLKAEDPIRAEAIGIALHDPPTEIVLDPKRITAIVAELEKYPSIIERIKNDSPFKSSR